MVKRFGVVGLDELFNGGFEESFSLGLLGAPGTNRDIFNYSFAEEGVLNEEPTLYFCSEKKGKSLLSEFDKRGFGESDFLEVIDGYSWRLREVEETVKFSLESSNLNEFLNQYELARNEVGNNGRLVIDSFSNLVDFADLSAINKVLKILLAEEKERNNSVLFSLSPDYRRSIVDLIEGFVDGFIELIKFGGDNFLKIHWLGDFDVDDSWYNYEVIEGLSKGGSLNVEVKEKASEELEEELSKNSRLMG